MSSSIILLISQAFALVLGHLSLQPLLLDIFNSQIPQAVFREYPLYPLSILFYLVTVKVIPQFGGTSYLSSWAFRLYQHTRPYLVYLQRDFL